MSGHRSGPGRRPHAPRPDHGASQRAERTRRAQQARLRGERTGAHRRVEAVVAPSALAFRSRVHSLIIVFVLAWGAVFVRSAWLTVGHSARLSDRLEGQHERVVTIAPDRGSIVDRLGRPLAISVELDSVFADPALVEDPVATAELVAPLLGAEVGDVAAKLGRADTRFVWLARQVSGSVAEAIAALDVPGVRITSEAHRDYPSGPLAAPILGMVGADGKGLEGLEARFDARLRGDRQQYRVLRDGRRRTVNHDALLGRRSTEGDTLVLTLDHSVQHRAEQALAAAIERHDAEAGWLVSLEAKTGAVLALASWPTFDPNEFRRTTSDQRRNRALSEVFEPGSTMKPFVIAEVLERGKTKRDEVIYCERGRMSIGRRAIHDAHPYDDLTVDEVLKFSSNIGTVKLGQRLGRTDLEETLRRYGFGAKTGIDLYGEEAGILRDSSGWKEIGFATHCFGQGMAVTGIQLASAFAALVNGGLAVQPHVVAELHSAVDGEIDDRRPAPGQRVLSEKTSEAMRQMLAGVMTDGGTGTRAALAEYSSGGKTGTAQKVKDGRYAKNTYVSSFIGFAPVDDPAVVTLVVLDEPKNKYYGGTVAGPVWKEVTRTALRALGVAPDKAEPSKLTAEQPEDALHEPASRRQDPATVLEAVPTKMPDLRDKPARAAVLALADAGVDIELEGSGLVVDQVPEPGAALAAIDSVHLTLALRDVPRKR